MSVKVQRTVTCHSMTPHSSHLVFCLEGGQERRSDGNPIDHGTELQHYGLLFQAFWQLGELIRFNRRLIDARGSLLRGQRSGHILLGWLGPAGRDKEWEILPVNPWLCHRQRWCQNPGSGWGWGTLAGLGSTHAVEGWRMRSEICLESWWELRTIMLCSVAGCCGMLMLMAPTFTTAALLVFSPLWALYRACDLAMLHFTTVLAAKGNSSHSHALPVVG